MPEPPYSDDRFKVNKDYDLCNLCNMDDENPLKEYTCNLNMNIKLDFLEYNYNYDYTMNII